jgi:Na+/melibiose symporter-like transporter
LGFPLAFVALPLYVLLPHHYASSFGVPLAALGGVLLAARLLDAVVDPWLGRWVDLLFGRSVNAVLGAGMLACLVLAAGLALLFFPFVREPRPLLVWAWATLVFTCFGYSLLSIAHQSWGARLGGDGPARSRVVAWREAAGLLGVVCASVLPAVVGLPAMLAVFALTLASGWLAWSQAPRPGGNVAAPAAVDAVWLPWTQSAFRRLMLVFVGNGIASAIPATLVLFFIEDRLKAPAAWQPVFLGTYFVFAALGMPLWLRLVRAWALSRTWLAGMSLSVLVFAWAALLGPGDWLGFWLVCALSGLALSADLALPGAMLAGFITRRTGHGEHAGAYFGWWNFATKLNLALAAGLALPLLGLWGYKPGAEEPDALQALTWAYAVLPCLLKVGAAMLLFTLVRIDPHFKES